MYSCILATLILSLNFWSPKSQLIPTAHVFSIFYICLGGVQLASHLGKVKEVEVLGHA